MTIANPSLLRFRARLFPVRLLPVAVIATAFVTALPAANADLILYGGKVITVDSKFSVAEAVAVKDGRIVAVGRTADVLARERGPQTRAIDLQGKTVLPGLVDAHLHALGAGLSEYRERLPVLHSYPEVQAYIRQQAAKKPVGEWIMVPKTFPTRLLEMRMPTRALLDVAGDHPVIYDASYSQVVNSYALKISGITRNTPDPAGARVVRDKSGEPNGILTRGAVPLLKGVPIPAFTKQEKLDALEGMLKRYLAAGLTSIGDGGVKEPEVEMYRELKAEGRLPLRVVMTWLINTNRPVDQIVSEIQHSTWVTNQGDEWLKFGAFKVSLDGGMDAGTAYMRQPYRSFATQLYGIDDPDNRGELFVPPDKLLAVMRAARDKGWQLTAHAQGGGAIDILLNVFETLNREHPIAPTRSHFIHGSFQSAESIARSKKLGVLIAAQPDWYYRDAVALEKVAPQEMRYFTPLRSMVESGMMPAGGSDHMIGWDKNTSVNAYNPFLGMWVAIARKTIQGEVIHPEERLTREDALRMYTVWPAYLQLAEKQRGSIEPGMAGDMVVIEQDYLTCPEDQIKDIAPLMTIVNGRIAYSR